MRFTTGARPHTHEERVLQEIQAQLSGGVTLLPGTTTLPHLALAQQQVFGQPAFAVITLWVPQGLEREAAALLSRAGFTLSP